MGAVYRARDPKLQRRIALKLLRVEHVDEFALHHFAMASAARRARGVKRTFTGRLEARRARPRRR
jgi:hypothetical protein